MKKKITSFSLNLNTIDMLKELSEKTDLAKSDIVRRAIEDYSRRVKNEE